MLMLDRQAVVAALDWKVAIEALRTMFRCDCTSPVRHHHTLNVSGEAAATLLLMPAWTATGYLGVKIVNVFPGNSARGRPAVSASYLLSSATTGEHLAIIDGSELTARRTAAASALAADYLARKDARRLLIMGTGRVARCLASAYCAVREIEHIAIRGRTTAKAEALAAELRVGGLPATAATDLRQEFAEADIVSCATLSNEPLFSGTLLAPGTHLDLVGGFTPTMREADDEAVRRSSIFVDTRTGALSEAGDIVIPIREGVITADAIRADLHDLARGTHPGRTSQEEITFFKSVGAALEDLAAGIAVYEKHSKNVTAPVTSNLVEA